MNKGVIWLYLISAGLVLGTLAACSSTPPAELTEDDKAAIYAVVARRIFGEDPISENRPDIPTVHLTGTLTQPKQATAIASLADLPAKFGWVGDLAKVPRDDRGEVQGVVIGVRSIRQQDDGSVEAVGSLTCGSLCGMRRIYTVERTDGAWTVVSAGPKAVS